MSTVADISGVDKLQLLKAVWEGAKHYDYDHLYEDTAYNEEEAKKIFESLEGNLEDNVVVCGKHIRCDLSGNTVDFKKYDYWNGAGAFNGVLQKFRPKQPQGNITQRPATEQSATGPTTNSQAPGQANQQQAATKKTPAWDRVAGRVHNRHGS